jgi:hypothetical protein
MRIRRGTSAIRVGRVSRLMSFRHDLSQVLGAFPRQPPANEIESAQNPPRLRVVSRSAEQREKKLQTL